MGFPAAVRAAGNDPRRLEVRPALAASPLTRNFIPHRPHLSPE
jgi:hypothetical protein